ncbi:small integral membrane protein 24 [Platysternon megacephalum]|uniref:Small integral membrane protein 24 n=1 Tax=Platysternon megacephalum TaxID=55544 RepID=A0A4D9E4J1_9SAUR|nr:small integral membrane protein 24 [Platysternon megacephalum]
MEKQIQGVGFLLPEVAIRCLPFFPESQRRGLNNLTVAPRPQGDRCCGNQPEGSLVQPDFLADFTGDFSLSSLASFQLYFCGLWFRLKNKIRRKKGVPSRPMQGKGSARTAASASQG